MKILKKNVILSVVEGQIMFSLDRYKILPQAQIHKSNGSKNTVILSVVEG